MTELENGLGNKFIVAAVQFCSNEDKSRNLKLANKYIDNAVKEGADVVVLPEMFNCCGHTKIMVENAEEIPGDTINFLSDKARTHGIYIVCGSIFEKVDANKVHNTSVVVGRNGEILARYAKVHLFDVDIQDKIRYKESENSQVIVEAITQTYRCKQMCTQRTRGHGDPTTNRGDSD